MSDMWILHDKQNRRDFCLGNVRRLWDTFLTDHIDGQELSLSEVERRIPEGSLFGGGSPEFSVKLWAFCQVAGWHVELRWNGIDHDDEWTGTGWETRWDPHPLVGSFYSSTQLDVDPCAEEQDWWEKEARRT